MNTPTPDVRRKCPDCQAVVDAGAGFCWLCRRDLHIKSEQTAEPAQDSLLAAAAEKQFETKQIPLQFSLTAVLVVITVVAVVLSAFVILPGLGIALVILLTPALVRTWLSTERARARGTPLPVQAKGRIFVLTLVLLIVSAIPAGIAFYAVCWVGVGAGFGADTLMHTGGYGALVGGFVAGMVLGGVVGLVVLILLIRRLWRRFF